MFVIIALQKSHARMLMLYRHTRCITPSSESSLEIFAEMKATENFRTDAIVSYL